MAKAKQSSTTMALHSQSTPSEREAANRTHHQELISATLDNALAVGHGHAVGSGPTGKMVTNDAHQQGKPHAYIPQSAFAKVPQNMNSRDGGPAFDDSDAAANYGTVDKTD